MEISVFGLSEKEIMKRLGDIRAEVSEHCLIGSITVDKKDFDAVRMLFFDECFSDAYENIDEVAARLLKEKHIKLGVAESLTGGEVCSVLCGIPGISENFYEGIVCYDKRSKHLRLGVKDETLERYGAISKETAEEMVKGLLSSGVDIGVSTTGLAGPSGDEGKPVGLTYIGVGNGKKIAVKEYHFDGDRREVRRKATAAALFALIKFIKEEY